MASGRFASFFLNAGAEERRAAEMPPDSPEKIKSRNG